MLDPHAAKAEIALRSFANRSLCGVSWRKIAIIVQEAELHLAHHVIRAGQLADIRFDIARATALPIDWVASIGSSLHGLNEATVW